jgi:hypothetical protein
VFKRGVNVAFVCNRASQKKIYAAGPRQRLKLMGAGRKMAKAVTINCQYNCSDKGERNMRGKGG